MNLTPELIQAMVKLHKDHHKNLLKIKEFLTPMVVEKQSGKGYKHSYIPTSDLLNIVNPILSKCDLAISCLFSGDDLVVMLIHPSGGYLQSRVWLTKEQVGRTPDGVQWRASRFTIMRRTAILGILNIDDGSPDDDGNDSEGNYHGSSKNEIIDTKGAEVVEAVKKKIKEMEIKPVKSQEGKKTNTTTK